MVSQFVAYKTALITHRSVFINFPNEFICFIVYILWLLNWTNDLTRPKHHLLPGRIIYVASFCYYGTVGREVRFFSEVLPFVAIIWIKRS